MKTWLINYWESLRANFWFVPTVMLLGSVALSLVTINLDKASGADNWVATLGWTFTRRPEGSRAVLSTAERILLDIAGRHTVPIGELGEAALLEMERRYFIRPADMTPRVYYRLTDRTEISCELPTRSRS